LNLAADDAPPPRVPAQLGVTKAGSPDGLLIEGDNLQALQALAAQSTKVTLAYLDPPFLTGRQHQQIERSRDEQGRPVRRLRPAFDDRWEDLGAYLTELRPRLAAVRDLLTEDGCMVLHVDPKTSHYLKVLCDELFGMRSFASEIIWRYRRWPSKTRNFQRVHDVLLRYVKNPDVAPKFTQLYEPLAASTVATWGTRRQRAVMDEGRRARSSSTQEESPGTPMGDVWEIGIVAPVARERTGYPTQKPEALLERLVRSCTDPGDRVLDPYAGSGTTLAVASRLGRGWVGIDANPEALQVARTRLGQQGISPTEAMLRERTVVKAADRGQPQRPVRVA